MAGAKCHPRVMSVETLRTIGHRIGGEDTEGASTRTAPVWEPASGQQQAQVLLAEPADVDRAVRTAREAAGSWGESSLAARSRVMFAFRELLAAHTDELARLVASEHGKTVADARGEVVRGIEVVEFAAACRSCSRASSPTRSRSGVDAYSFRQPLGVCAGITPFNFPAMVPMWMHPVAIATGNTFVLKPSERDPSPSLLVAELSRRRGCPTACSTSSRRQGRGRRDARSSGRQRRVVRRLDADRPLHLRARRTTASACRRSVAPRTTRS